MDQLSDDYSKTMFFNEHICNWIDAVHTELCKQYEMPKKKINRDNYGFDSYAAVLRAILSAISSQDIMDAIRGQVHFQKFVEVAHGAWIDNYIKWKNICPDNVSDNPKKTINTIKRNDRATTQSSNLNTDDLGMYQDMISVIFDILTRKILEAGIQSMAL